MSVRALLRRDTYQDSVNLMLLAARLQELPGVETAAAVMGTPANKRLLAEAGLLDPEIESAGAGDLCLAIRATSDRAMEAALRLVDALLSDQAHVDRGRAANRASRSVEGALARLPGANLALISVPGPYAAAEAWKALERDLHVFLFSDNVPLEDEVALKREAERRGLLLMGPDCGTAIVGGVALGFANRVPRGPVGLAGSSGTGLQELSCLLAHLGSGLSHALGTGSRDLSAAIGGSTTRLALRALLADPSTELAVWVAKPGDPAVAESLLDEFANPPKPLIAMLLGLPDRAQHAARFPAIRFAETLEQAALWAAELAGGPALTAWSHNLEEVARRVAELGSGQRALRGIYSGGTLAAEAAGILGLSETSEAETVPPGAVLASGPHLIVDYGDDHYTRGRAHPMIDPRVRQEAIRAAGQDPRVGLVLFDLVLGYGAHEDPAAALVPAIAAASEAARRRGGSLLCIGHLCGTHQDPQSYEAQRTKLAEAGVLVAWSAAQAARYAAAALAQLARQDG
jgi:FdrA protein